MAKFFYDYEFIEHFVSVGTFRTRKVHTIEPIELGIVDESSNELSILYNDFDTKAVWQNEWLRENVVKPMYEKDDDKALRMGFSIGKFSYDWFKRYIKLHGVNRKDASKKIKDFISSYYNVVETTGIIRKEPIEFVSWFSSYDHICLCSTFGKMDDLPEGFPMFTTDIQQILEEKIKLRNTTLKAIERRKDFPQQSIETVHAAIYDAKYHKQLFEFVNSL